MKCMTDEKWRGNENYSVTMATSTCKTNRNRNLREDSAKRLLLKKERQTFKKRNLQKKIEKMQFSTESGLNSDGGLILNSFYSRTLLLFTGYFIGLEKNYVLYLTGETKVLTYAFLLRLLSY